jgi:ABC-2 type transport system ATP-binding protein
MHDGKAIVVRNLHKDYGEVHAVQGIDFDVHTGEIFSLLGPNGAGKTTTINMLSCLLEPTDGDAWVMGHSIRTDTMAVKRAIGVVPQEVALYPDLSARENLSFWGKMYGLRGAALRQRVDEVLETIGLTERQKGQVDKFSGGMKRRLNIGIGLLPKPQILFLDEPTVGIDPQSRRNILDQVKEFNRQGMTILYTTHYMEEAELLCHRVAVMDEGRIIALDTPHNLINTLGMGIIHIGVMDVDHGMVARLQALTQVKAVNRRDYTLTFETVDAQRALLDIIGLLNETDTPMTSLEILEPNLERFHPVDGEAVT